MYLVIGLIPPMLQILPALLKKSVTRDQKNLVFHCLFLVWCKVDLPY